MTEYDLTATIQLSATNYRNISGMMGLRNLGLIHSVGHTPKSTEMSTSVGMKTMTCGNDRMVVSSDYLTNFSHAILGLTHRQDDELMTCIPSLVAWQDH